MTASSVAVVKIGTSSIVLPSGDLDDGALVKLAADLADVHATGRRVVLVMSGAIAAGMPPLGFTTRPSDIGTLQAISAVGQPRLLERMRTLLAAHGVVVGQVLLTPYDFLHRSQYLHAKATLQQLLNLGVLPIINENDAVADDEIRYGDNDRLAALVGHMLVAEVLLLLTDTNGLFTADPRRDGDASLIEEVLEIDAALEDAAGGAGTARGSGGMASKLAAAKIAKWSGARTVIASAAVPNVVADAVDGRAVGTAFAAGARRLSSRKLWIAFARRSEGQVVVDSGARTALVERGKSLLLAGVRNVVGDFDAEAAVEIVDESGQMFAKGLCEYTSQLLQTYRGRQTSELPPGFPDEVVHRDNLVVMGSS